MAILRRVFLMAGLEGIYRMTKLTCIWALSWKVRAWGSLSEKCPFGCFYPFQSSAEGRSSSELRTFRTAWGGEGWESVILAVLSVESHRSGYRTIHDFTVQRGRSPLWIPNHPRYRGSAWKVTALNIEPSTISRFSVEGHRSGYRTIHDLMVQRGRSCSGYRTIHDFMVQRGRSPPGSRHKAGGASQRRNSRSLL